MARITYKFIGVDTKGTSVEYKITLSGTIILALHLFDKGTETYAPTKDPKLKNATIKPSPKASKCVDPAMKGKATDNGATAIFKINKYRIFIFNILLSRITLKPAFISLVIDFFRLLLPVTNPSYFSKGYY